MQINPKSIKFVEMQNTKAHQVLSLSSTVENSSVSDKKLCIEFGVNFYSFCISDQSGKEVIAGIIA